MTGTAEDLLASIRAGLPHEEENRLVPLIASGGAPLATIGALGAEETLIVASDRRSFLLLAARAEQPDAVAFLAGLGQGEGLALARLPALTRAAGMTDESVAAYQPRPGCQAYPAYVAWLAINADPAGAIATMMVNFAAWGSYCATVASALREHYGFDDEACGFFDFFATPVPEMQAQALAAIQAALDAGADLSRAHRYARLLQSYEIRFWNTLADGS
jgi:TENA/THI-4/PQQC family